jgi:hypothetical protein
VSSFPALPFHHERDAPCVRNPNFPDLDRLADRANVLPGYSAIAYGFFLLGIGINIWNASTGRHTTTEACDRRGYNAASGRPRVVILSK